MTEHKEEHRGSYHYEKPVLPEVVELKHTRGPWKACHDGNCSCGMVWGNEFPIVGVLSSCRKDEGYNLGEGLKNSSDEYKANYLLVTAAPDLLDACLAVVGDKIHPDIAKRMAEIAVKKALGQ